MQFVTRGNRLVLAFVAVAGWLLACADADAQLGVWRRERAQEELARAPRCEFIGNRAFEMNAFFIRGDKIEPRMSPDAYHACTAQENRRRVVPGQYWIGKGWSSTMDAVVVGDLCAPQPKVALSYMYFSDFGAQHRDFHHNSKYELYLGRQPASRIGGDFGQSRLYLVRLTALIARQCGRLPDVIEITARYENPAADGASPYAYNQFFSGRFMPAQALDIVPDNRDEQQFYAQWADARAARIEAARAARQQRNEDAATLLLLMLPGIAMGIDNMPCNKNPTPGCW